ncbi:MAG: hypothetical protein WED00_14925 [Aquisalimonadaceae bacterium]
MRYSLIPWIALAALFGLSLPLSADTTPANEACSVKSRSDAVVIVVCEPGVSEQGLREAGRAACGDNAQCNAWIWDDSAAAPATAPARDADLPKDRSGAAVAVWVNDTGSLLTIKRMR